MSRWWRKWRLRRLASILREENVEVELNVHNQFWLLLFRTKPMLRHKLTQFRKWAVLPGDTFEDFQRNERYRITKVKMTYCEAEIIDSPYTELNGRRIIAFKDWQYDRWLFDHERNMKGWILYGA